MNVLSLFDGISCGQQALKELAVPVEKYYASEIDKYTISITQRHFPDTIQLGDIEEWRHWDMYCSTCGEHYSNSECTSEYEYNNDLIFCYKCNDQTKKSFDWSKIDLIQGGSPCQGFSFAGKQLNFDDPRSKLFFTFVDILNHARKHNPDVKFMLENVRMKQEYQDVISERLGVQPVKINSALVSAQNRQRLYWTNITELEQPEDKGILLKDILEVGAPSDVKKDSNYIPKEITTDFVDPYNKKCIKGDKSTTLRTNSSNGNMWVNAVMRVPEATKKGYTEAKVGEGLGLTFPNSKTRRGRLMKHKSNCLTAGNHEMGVVVDRDKSYCLDANYHKGANWEQYKKKCRRQLVGSELSWRKLTPLECERLQTLPDGYTAHGIGLPSRKGLPKDSIQKVSNTQRYKALGNGWTVAVIKHIYKSLL